MVTLLYDDERRELIKHFDSVDKLGDEILKAKMKNVGRELDKMRYNND